MKNKRDTSLSINSFKSIGEQYELEKKEQARNELLRRIISAQEQERQRIARELHDVTSQTLATLAVGIERLSQSGLKESRPAPQVEEIRSLLAATSQDIHRIIYDLRPSIIDDFGLPAAINSFANNTLKAAGVEVHFEIAGREKHLPEEIEITVYRIVQEAIRNIERHARAESTFISLEFEEDNIRIQIEDDGTGFDNSNGFIYNETGQGLGLLGMKERTELLRGSLFVDSKPGKGTKITVRIPTN